MPVTLPEKLDPASQWLVKNGFPLTLENWLELNYWRKVKLSELDAEAIAEIPDYLLPKKDRRRKARAFARIGSLSFSTKRNTQDSE